MARTREYKLSNACGDIASKASFPRCRESLRIMIRAFTSSVATQITNMIQILRDFMNDYIFGPNGPAKAFQGPSQPPPPPPTPREI